MPLNNIKVWSDGEVITHDDLNSIGEAVSQTLSGGSIAPTQLAWPFVAQGDIDMNGYTIRNLESLSGVIHVNDEKTLLTAINAATSGSVIVVDPAASAVATAADIEISGKSNLTIIGYGTSVEVAVGSGVTNYGLKVANNCNGVHIVNLRFTGGTTGKPAVYIEGGSDNKCYSCKYDTPIGLLIGSLSTVPSGFVLDKSVFDGCDIGVKVNAVITSDLSGNTFDTCTLGMKLPDTTDGAAFSLTNIKDNKFDGCTDGIQGLYTGSASVNWGQSEISGNKFVSVSGKGLDVLGYYQMVIDNNVSQAAVAVGGNQCAIADNVFYGTTALTITDCIVKDNVLWGAVSNVSSGTGNSFDDNRVQAAFTLSGTWIKNMRDNEFVGGITYSAYPTGVYGGNTGYGSGVSPASAEWHRGDTKIDTLEGVGFFAAVVTGARVGSTWEIGLPSVGLVDPVAGGQCAAIKAAFHLDVLGTGDVIVTLNDGTNTGTICTTAFASTDTITGDLEIFAIPDSTTATVHYTIFKNSTTVAATGVTTVTNINWSATTIKAVVSNIASNAINWSAQYLSKE